MGHLEIWAKNVLSRGNSKCKCAEIGMRLPPSRKSKKVSVAGVERVEDEVKEIREDLTLQGPRPFQ